MFKIITVRENARVPPVKFDMELNQAVKESLQEQLEGKLNPDMGVFLVVTEVVSVGEGKIIPEDGAIYYPTEFKMMIFKPEINEVLLGEVVDITEFGAFTRIGPIDALVHVSQIMDDKIAYDGKNAIFTGKKSGCKLREGDIIRTRVVGVSLGKGRNKISLTMRQPFLGAVEWIEKEKKKSGGERKEEKKREKKK
ncbi:MAG: DNA-directed RNA polymerase [Candidatus Aenigmarchaeota archaeon]|nr:DNA-directed RNA polymerase [Candidatus Aenigmarchaeota archaeon]MDI6722629.1 DNA-directed RNA polymerase [Candidatus Aenigmarchaeota archaeon]